MRQNTGNISFFKIVDTAMKMNVQKHLPEYIEFRFQERVAVMEA